MPRGKTEKIDPILPNPVGRPPEYSKGHPATALKLCKLGMTDSEIAQFFEVNPLTIYRWKHEHPEFCKALRRGKDLADDMVEESLFKRAVGHSHETVKVFMPAGARAPVYAEYVEYFPPDPGAAKSWLSNRRPEKWRESTNVNHSGTLSLEGLINEAVALRAKRTDSAQ